LQGFFRYLKSKYARKFVEKEPYGIGLKEVRGRGLLMYVQTFPIRQINAKLDIKCPKTVLSSYLAMALYSIDSEFGMILAVPEFGMDLLDDRVRLAGLLPDPAQVTRVQPLVSTDGGAHDLLLPLQQTEQLYSLHMGPLMVGP
jgi:hypothetical protein